MAGAGAAAAGLVALTAKTIEAGGRLTDLKEKSGTTASFLQKIGYAAKLTGSDVDAFSKGLGVLQRNLVGAASGEGAKIFKQLGLDAAQLRQQAPEKTFYQVAEAIRGLKNPYEQAAAAQAVFGKGGLEMLPAIKAGLKEAGEEAERLGFIMSDRTVAAADALGDTIDTLKMAVGGLGTQIGGVVVENAALHTFLRGATDLVADLSGKIRDNRGELNDWVTNGVLLGVRGLQLMADAAVLGLKAFHELNLLWVSSQKIAVDMSLAMAKASQYVAALIGDDTAVAKYNQVIALLEAEKRGLSDDAGAIVEAQARIDAAAAQVRAGIETLEGRVRTAASANMAFAASAGAAAAGLGKLGQAAEKLPKLPTTDNYAFFNPQRGGFFAPQPLPDRVDRLPTHPMSGQQFNVLPQTMQANAKATFDWSKALGNVAHAFQVLGVNAQSTLGRILGGLTALGGSLDQLKGLGKGGFLSGLTGGKGLGGLVNSLGAGLGILGAGLSIGKGILGFLIGKPKERPEQMTLEQRFGKLREAYDAGGDGRAYLDFIRREQASGRPIKEVQEVVRANVETALDKTAQLISGWKIGSAEDARAQAGLFHATFLAAVKEKGLPAAAAALKDAFAKLKAGAQEAGVTLAGFDEIARMMALGENEAFAAAAGRGQDVTEILKALGASGYLTQGALDSAGTVAQQQVAAALAAGATNAEALQSVMPLLAEAQRQAKDYGYEIPEEIANLITDAQKEGLKLPTSIAEKQLTVLEQIRDRVGGHPPPPPGGGGNGNGNGGGNGGGGQKEDIQGYAFGGKVDRDPSGEGRIIRVAEREREFIVPDSQKETFAEGVLGAGGGGKAPAASVLSGLGSQIAELVAAVKSQAPSVAVQSPVELRVDENPIRNAQDREEMRQFTLHQIARAVRDRDRVVVESLRGLIREETGRG